MRCAGAALLHHLLFVAMKLVRPENLDLESILPERPGDYDSLEPPKENGNPTVVRFHFTVLSLDSIDEGSMTYVADIFMSQTWHDHRLRLPRNMTAKYRLLPVSWLKRMWRPDSFFKNAKRVTFQEMTIPNHYIWLYSDRRILYMVNKRILGVYTATCGYGWQPNEVRVPFNRKTPLVAHFILVLGSAVLTSVNIYYMLWEKEPTEFIKKSTLEEISAEFAMAVSLVILAVLCWSRISRTLGSSGFSCGILGLLATSTITDSILLVRQLFQQQETIVWHAVFEHSQVALTTAVAVLMCGCFLAAGLQDTVSRRSSKSRKVKFADRDEDNTSTFGRLFCVLLMPLLKMNLTGAKPSDEVLPRLRGALRCGDIVYRLHSLLSKNVRRRIDFVAALWRVLWMDAFRVALCTFAYFACLFVKVPLLE
ncbi:uncharacterized protein LOC120837580 [Ixodes scapularis]|uniref:uncharacterized protein LOC120837580 n=1 Tax=Ixodes scapularis TaxID=6945 RepID=UPI001C38B72C|nr:uncharacterized protein LOC120837580 [Ixodes scapularis]